MAAQFAVRGLETGSDLLGLWQVAPQPVSFAAPGAGAEEGGVREPAFLVWSVSLPADAAEAGQAIQEQTRALRVTQSAINQAGQFLESLSPAQATVSFGVGQIDELPEPEARLMESLAHLRGDEATTAFTLGFLSRLPGLPDGWQATIAEYRAFVQQVFQLMRPTLRVETKIENALLAYTLVRLTGDFDTAWGRAQTTRERQMHQRVLSLTLQSRVALLQLLAQTSAGAAALAARFSIPGGAVVALPAAWRYIQDVMKQARQLAALQELQRAR